MSYLESSRGILSDLVGHLGASWALLEPYWAILDPLTTRPLLSRPRGGGRGRGQVTTLAQAVSLIPTRPPNTQVAPEPQHVRRPSLDGQLLGTKSDPMCATLGPKRARHAWCARCATCSTCGNILGHICGPREHFPLQQKQYKVLAGPTNMTQYVAPKCSLYCFFCKGKCSQGPTNMTKYVAARGARGASGAPGAPGTLGWGAWRTCCAWRA